MAVPRESLQYLDGIGVDTLGDDEASIDLGSRYRRGG
jgi:hypothetical protein